jgi:hypothetical protein
MPLDERGEFAWPCRLGFETVREGRCIVVSVPESCRDLSETHTILIEQGGVRSAKYVPAHALDAQRAEGLAQGVEGIDVRKIHREVEFLEQFVGAWLKGYDALTVGRLGGVGASPAVLGTPDVEVTVPDVLPAEGDSLPEPQASEEHEFGHTVPWMVKHLDGFVELRDRDVVPPLADPGDARARRWNW